MLISLAFSWYVAHFGSCNKTYGSLGAAIGFMTWIWISATIVLVGAELNAEMEHRRSANTTIGTEKPLGSRGTTKADTVALAGELPLSVLTHSLSQRLSLVGPP